jgi:hypothetical protein
VTIVRVLIRSLVLLLSNRLRFPRSDIGRVLTMEDGEQFTVFRHAKVKAPGTFSGVNIFRFGNDGKVVELWNHRDDLGLREQLVAPVFAGAPTSAER